MKKVVSGKAFDDAKIIVNRELINVVWVLPYVAVSGLLGILRFFSFNSMRYTALG